MCSSSTFFSASFCSTLVQPEISPPTNLLGCCVPCSAPGVCVVISFLSEAVFARRGIWLELIKERLCHASQNTRGTKCNLKYLQCFSNSWSLTSLRETRYTRRRQCDSKWRTRTPFAKTLFNAFNSKAAGRKAPRSYLLNVKMARHGPEEARRRPARPG